MNHPRWKVGTRSVHAINGSLLRDLFMSLRQEAPPRPPTTILVVDDQASTRALLREALARRRGTVVLEAADGEAALAIIEEQRPDVVLCDIQMQPVDGLTLLRVMRAHEDERIRKMPVIIMSAVATREAVTAATKAGATSILAKPISLRMLAARLDAALGT